MAVAYYVAMILVAWGFKKWRAALVIDEEGITVREFSETQFVPWGNVGHYETYIRRGQGKYQDFGSAIALKQWDEADGDQGKIIYNPVRQYENRNDLVLFIPEEKIAATAKEIEEAIQEGIDYYVHQRRKSKRPATWADIEGRSKGGSGVEWLVWLLLAVWVIFNCYVLNLYHGLISDQWSSDMFYTLSDGENNHSILGGEFLAAWVMIAYFVLAFTPIFLFSKSYKGAAFTLVATILVPTTFYLMELPYEQELLENCSKPTRSPQERVQGVVVRNQRTGRDFKLQVSVEYDKQHYTINRYGVEGAEKGMTATVVIQRGAKGIPIVRDIIIPDAKWSLQGEREARIKEESEQKEIRTADEIFDSLFQSDNREDTLRNAAEEFWQEQDLRVDGHNLGKWRVIMSSSSDVYGEPVPIESTHNYAGFPPRLEHYHMLAAVSLEKPRRVLLVVGTSDNELGFKTKAGQMDKRMKVWFGQRAIYCHPKPHTSVPNVWTFNSVESESIADRMKRAPEFTVVTNRNGEHVVSCFIFEVAKKK